MNEKPPTDFQQLLRSALSGDADAISQLIDRYRSYLLFVANEEIDDQIRAKAAPSDVVQVSVIHAQENFAQFQGKTESEFRSWLRAILTNDLRKTRRGFLTKKRDAHCEINIDDQSAVGRSLVDPTLTPSANAVGNEKMTLVSQAFDELSPDHQTVIRLRNFEGLDFNQVGQEMQRGPDAACKLWARAIEALRRILDSKAPGLFDEQFKLID